MAIESIYWAVENSDMGFLLHGFNDAKARDYWLWETLGLTVGSLGGRGLIAELPRKDNPLITNYTRPVIWH